MQIYRLYVEKNYLYTPEGRKFVCAIGPSGVSLNKKEGDGATPIGTFPLRKVLYRPDRLQAPTTSLHLETITPDDGWCDDPTHSAYNKSITFPFNGSAEKMWREDHVYDVCVILGHNDDPPIPGKGSAIFFHLARQDYAPTEGCIAVHLEDMLEILEICTPQTVLEVGPLEG